jgi:hypothetical protein
LRLCIRRHTIQHGAMPDPQAHTSKYSTQCCCCILHVPLTPDAAWQWSRVPWHHLTRPNRVAGQHTHAVGEEHAHSTQHKVPIAHKVGHTCSTARHSRAQHNTAWHSAAQCAITGNSKGISGHTGAGHGAGATIALMRAAAWHVLSCILSTLELTQPVMCPSACLCLLVAAVEQARTWQSVHNVNVCHLTTASRVCRIAQVPA